MARRTITAVFDSRSKAEEAVSRLSQLGLNNIFMKTSRYLPDFSPTGIGSLAFFWDGGRDIEFTIVSGSLPADKMADAERIIASHGGLH